MSDEYEAIYDGDKYGKDSLIGFVKRYPKATIREQKWPGQSVGFAWINAADYAMMIFRDQQQLDESIYQNGATG